MALTTALEEFRALLGAKGFVDDSDTLAPWLTDWRGRYTGKAAAMLLPQTTAEVADIVRIAGRHKVSLVPQGGNSGMVAGATPDNSGANVLLSLRRMNKIHSVNAENGLVAVEAGVVLQTLHEAVSEHGRRFPLTLGGKGSATVGGLISTNAGGTQVLRHGTMRQLVEGIEAVLPDGSIYNGLAPLKKDNRGYDLKHLLIAAEGTIGIVTGAVLRTVPALIDRCVLWAGVASPDMAYQLLLFMQHEANDHVEGFEILPQRALNAVLRHIPNTRAPLQGEHHWHILVEFVQDRAGGSGPAQHAETFASNAMEAGLIEDAALSANETQAEAFWKIRDSIAEAERAMGPALQHDISVPVSDMARFIEAETPDVEARFPGTTVVAFGHLGDGNIHFHVKAPDGVDPQGWYASMAETISGHVYDRVQAYNGSISAEHGIGLAKLDQFARLSDPARLGALRAIKAAFDPMGIMNPGKLVPLATRDSAD
jgi:FAD/FMN-containing dehydrogenase